MIHHGPNPHDDTSSDYEQFEKAQLAQDHGAAGVDIADVDVADTKDIAHALIDSKDAHKSMGIWKDTPTTVSPI